jgi:hypothetical protein
MCKSSLDAESNDVEDDAIDLGELECGVLDGVQGTIDGDDLDWFTYHGVDDGCEGSTTAIITADQELEVCVYFVCDAGNPQVVCQVGEATDSPGGHHGCCGVDNVIFDSNECLGATMNDSGTVHMSVGPVDGTSPMCTDYEVGYRFL